MMKTNSMVQMTLSLPITTYESLVQVAKVAQKNPEELLNSLITEELDRQSNINEILNRISGEYRNRLSKEGKLDQSSELIMEKLSKIREEIADELYS